MRMYKIDDYDNDNNGLSHETQSLFQILLNLTVSKHFFHQMTIDDNACTTCVLCSNRLSTLMENDLPTKRKYNGSHNVIFWNILCVIIRTLVRIRMRCGKTSLAREDDWHKILFILVVAYRCGRFEQEKSNA